MKKQIRPHIFSFFILIFIYISCSKDENEFTIGQEFIESQSAIIIIDTFGIELSTVIIDSISTSGTETILIGSYEDETFGKVTSNSFFQVGLPDNHQVDENAIYDSITLLLTYSDYTYGDTTQPFRIIVHELLEEIELNESGYLYNTSSVAYSLNDIGQETFIPQPGIDDSIEIRLNDYIGLDLFNKLVEEDEQISTETNFLNYFKGIAIVSDENKNSAVLGFKANEDDLLIRIYSHKIEETLKKLCTDFPLVNSDRQFNQIEHDFSNIILAAVEDQREAVPSSATGNKTYIQGGTALMTKLRFPTIQDILLFEQGIIIKAEVIVTPVKASYSIFSLPEDLILYETDKINRLGNIIYNSSGTVNTPSFVLDELYNEETSYTFDITDFIDDELSDNYFDCNHGLLISLYPSDFMSSFERLVLEAVNPSPKLKLYYLSY
jgi:hypothetical protein